MRGGWPFIIVLALASIAAGDEARVSHVRLSGQAWECWSSALAPCGPSRHAALRAVTRRPTTTLRVQRVEAASAAHPDDWRELGDPQLMILGERHPARELRLRGRGTHELWVLHATPPFSDALFYRVHLTVDGRAAVVTASYSVLSIREEGE